MIFDLDVRYHRDFQRYFLHVPAGTDREYATQLTAEESLLWQCGDKAELAARLSKRLGVRLGAPREGWLARLKRWIAARLPQR